jgi:lysine 2,3-aminomutase
LKQKTLRSATDLASAGLIDATEVPAISEVAKKYAVAISPQLQEILDRPGIKQQFVPSVAELYNSPSDQQDPIGDNANSPLKGIIHRYPDRCLLQPVRVCPVYCRFCFRRETVGPGNAALTQTELEACYKYIAEHPAIWEVILSGGDPLILKPQQLANIIMTLDQIEHVEIIRIHSRVPILDSARIDTAMLQALTQRRPIYIVLHINHAAEFSDAAIAAIEQLANNGIVLLGQTVLLKGINDNAATLGQLMRTMVKHRIKPYYLHQADLAAGTSHFRTTIAAGQKLMAALRGNYSGLCQPQYMLDIPGGAGKSPLGPTYITETEQGYVVNDYNGVAHNYNDTV